MSSIDKPKGEKYWKITFYVGGRRFRRSLRVEAKTHAQKIKQRIDYELAMGTLDVNNLFANKLEKRTIAHLVDKFLENLKTRKSLSQLTQSAYRRAAKKLLEMTPDNMQIPQFDQRYLTTVILPELEAVYRPSSVSHYIQVWSGIFSFGKKIGLLDRNPLEGQIPKVDRKMPVYFKDHEVKAIRDYFYHPDREGWQRTYFLTMLNTGNRREEHAKLSWSKNIFLNEGFIKFVGKGNKERLVPLNDEAAHLFRTADRRLGDDRVFWQIKALGHVSNQWARIRKYLDLPSHYRLHNFRSNFATRFVMAGGSLYDLMQILGWEDYDTAKIYLAFSPDLIAKNRNRVRMDF